MFYYFLHVYKEDEAFVCLDINKEGLRTDQLSVFICLKGLVLSALAWDCPENARGCPTGVASGQDILRKNVFVSLYVTEQIFAPLASAALAKVCIFRMYTHTPAANVISLLCSSSVERASHVREEGAGGGVPPQSAGAANWGGHLHRWLGWAHLLLHRLNPFCWGRPPV